MLKVNGSTSGNNNASACGANSASRSVDAKRKYFKGIGWASCSSENFEMVQATEKEERTGKEVTLEGKNVRQI